MPLGRRERSLNRSEERVHALSCSQFIGTEKSPGIKKRFEKAVEAHSGTPAEEESKKHAACC